MSTFSSRRSHEFLRKPVGMLYTLAQPKCSGIEQEAANFASVTLFVSSPQVASSKGHPSTAALDDIVTPRKAYTSASLPMPRASHHSAKRRVAFRYALRVWSLLICAVKNNCRTTLPPRIRDEATRLGRS